MLTLQGGCGEEEEDAQPGRGREWERRGRIWEGGESWEGGGPEGEGGLAILRDSLDSNVGSCSLGVVEEGLRHPALLGLTHATFETLPHSPLQLCWCRTRDPIPGTLYTRAPPPPCIHTTVFIKLK